MKDAAVSRPGAAGSVEPVISILVVDDNASKRLAIVAVLAPLGYDIVEADSGEAALRAVIERDFAMILLDVRMPGVSGLETATLIRQRRQSEMTPIAFLTAHSADEGLEADGYAGGAIDFITMPVRPDVLRAKVAFFAALFLRAETLAAEAREVQAHADQLRLLTEAAPIGIFQTDMDNRYIYTNPRWTEITGVGPEEAVGRKWDMIVSPEQRTRLDAELAGEAPHPGELGHRFEVRPEGADSRIVMVTSKSMSGPGGGITGWVGTLADVTAESGAEAAMSHARDSANEASRLKSEFLANMSHEIRTPMNGVLGMTDLLLETDLDARQHDYAQTVRNSGTALLTIIDDILDFSKIEAGKFEIDHVEFGLASVVASVVDLLIGPAQDKGLDLRVAIDAGVPAVVVGDPGRVRQVLTNLIGNAVKFTPRGEIVVGVTTAGLVDTDTILRFEIADTGEGIAADKLATVFQPFVQADASTSRRHGGTGLGLAISSQLVDLMGGRVGVTSRLGEGSTFWFTIHVRAVVGEASPSVLSPDPELTGLTALIAEDNAIQRRVLAEYLTELGMVAETADSGRAALLELRAAAGRGRPYAVIFMDRPAPGVDRIDLQGAIDGDPALHPSVVVMTELGQEAELAGRGRSRVGASLSKPVHRSEVRPCLRLALGLGVVPTKDRDAPQLPPPPVPGPTVGHLLLAEDNLINQKVAVAMLSGAGYEVETVLNGAAAVAAVASRSYDVVLMDCQMPELDGYEATAAIRAQEGGSRRTPIIAMTAGARQEDQERCLQAGMDDYLAKPVGKEALLAMVGDYVRHGPKLRSGGRRRSDPRRRSSP